MLKFIKVVYEDAAFAVFEKPAGILVVPTPKKETNTMVDVVNREYRTPAETEKWYPCHRLDRDTSGLIIFAKGTHNQELMMNEFRRQAVKKDYIAFVHGKLRRPIGEIKSHIRDLDSLRFDRDSAAKLAVTRYRVADFRRNYCVVEVNPVTGRTNQIRIQFAEIGHPLLGERKYAFAKDYPLKFRRTALHAQKIVWRHPISKKTIEVESPLPKDMSEFLYKN